MPTLEKAKTKTTINPANGESLKEYTLLDEERALESMEEVHQAFLGWRTRPIEERAKVLKSIAEALASRSGEISQLMTEEMGKTLQESQQEVELCAQICLYTADKGPDFLKQEERDFEGGRALISYEALGIVFGIQPWNFPLYQALRYSIPNLLAGNSVVLKHASNVWGTGDLIEDIFVSAGLPAGVFRHLKISHQTAETLMKHRYVRGITFTGSSGAGADIAQIAASSLTKSVLELGSNDAYLVLEDADLETAVKACVLGRVNNCGQTCVAVKRIIVVDKIYDKFREAYLKALREVKVGDPLEETTDMGPMARKDLRESLQEQVNDSVSKGAKLSLGGKIPEGKGFFYPVTLLENVTPGMPAYDEEMFGPVASLIRADDEEDAIRIANDSRFGLGGGIFSKDVGRATKIALERFDTGMVNINGYHLAQPNLPFGGVKDSGYGREHGGFGIREFVNVKCVMLSD